MWHDITALGLHIWSNNVGWCMTSPSLDSTHGKTTSSVAGHHRPWTTHSWRTSGMGSTHSRTTSGVACHHIPWTANTTAQRRAWHEITGLDCTHRRMTSGFTSHHHHWTARRVGQRRAWHDITALGLHRRSNDVVCGMTSPPLESIHDQTTSGVAGHHHPWSANTVRRRRAWHDITAFGQHIWSNDVGHGMPS